MDILYFFIYIFLFHGYGKNLRFKVLCMFAELNETPTFPILLLGLVNDLFVVIFNSLFAKSQSQSIHIFSEDYTQ